MGARDCGGSLQTQPVADGQRQPMPADSNVSPTSSVDQLHTESPGVLQPTRLSPRSLRRPQRKKALLIGITYDFLEGQQLVGPHNDVLDIKRLLIGASLAYSSLILIFISVAN